MKKPFILHPFLFAIFPVLFLFSHNIEEVLFSETLLPLAVISGFTGLVMILLRLFLRDNIKTGIIASTFLILFFSYGHVFDLIDNHWRLIDNFIIHLSLLFTWGTFFIWGTYFIIRTRKKLHNFTNFLNITAFSLIIFSLTGIGTYKLKTDAVWRNAENIKSTEEIKIDTVYSEKPDTLRDIYYIILDRYASADSLKDFYDFDNSAFIRYLSDKGFYVASRSRANYPTTFSSVASSLNMGFIDSLSAEAGEESNLLMLCRAISQSKAARFLKNKGYKVMHFSASYYPKKKDRYADEDLDKYLIPRFMMILYKSTMLYPVGAAFDFFDSRREQWKRVFYTFDKISEISNMKEPTFVFAHMLIPHFPYIFDRNGNFKTRRDERSKDATENYIDQLIFTNKKMENLINTLLSNSEIPPIIILQADEGPYPRRYDPDEKKFSWKKATDEEFRKKFGILNAYYLPNVDKSTLYPSITPVNSFRLIFNLYFNTDFELLPDKSYFFTDSRRIYSGFYDITDRIKYD